MIKSAQAISVRDLTQNSPEKDAGNSDRECGRAERPFDPKDGNGLSIEGEAYAEETEITSAAVYTGAR